MSEAFTDDEVRALKSLASFIMGMGNGGGGGATVGGPTAAASDADLLGQYGDPEVRKDPKRWAGASYVGARYSECPSDYLIVLAESLEYFAAKDAQNPEARKHRNGTPFWKYNLIDAGRARGWARRNKGLEKAPPAKVESSADDGPPPDDAGTGDDNVPF